MPDGETSARFDLPLLMAGQAQKEVTHNEALALIDLALCPVVEAIGVTAPPPLPTLGQAWIVGSAPTGAWIGAAHALAGWTAGGWRFVQLPVGATIIVRVSGLIWRRNSTGWVAAPAVAAPIGGPVADAECRAALSALVAALASQGLVATV